RRYHPPALPRGRRRTNPSISRLPMSGLLRRTPEQWAAPPSYGRLDVPAEGRRRPGTRGFVMARQDVLDCLRLLLDCQEPLGNVLDSVVEQDDLRDGHLRQVQPKMPLLDHHGGHHLTQGPRRDLRSCITP
ncbi:hypothetical protein M9458_037504, partial [Cirrhinus mrigala]